MTVRSPTYLKGRFETGDIPTQTDYQDVFDSYLNIGTSAEQSLDGPIKVSGQLTATSVSAATGNFTTSLESQLVTAQRVSTSALNVTTLGIIAALQVTGITSAQETFAATAHANQFIVDNKLFLTAETSINAVATTQASALLINNNITFIMDVTGQNNAVRLPPGEASRVQYVINASTSVLKVFPPSGGTFIGTAANTSLAIPAERSAMVVHRTATSFFLGVL